MALSLPDFVLDSLTELILQHLGVVEGDHPIPGAVEHGDAIPADLVCQLCDLSRTLVVPPGRNGLQHEPLSGEAFLVGPLVQLPGGEPVAIRGVIQARVFRLLGVRQREELVREQTVGDLVELNVNVARNEHVDALSEVLDKRDRAYQTGRRGYQAERRDVRGDEEAEFLCDHAAHADAYYV